MAKIKANSIEDIRLLASCFLTIPQENKWIVMARVYELGLMNFKGITGWLVRLLRKYKEGVGVFHLFNYLNKSNPKEIDKCIEDTIYHIVKGEDDEDSDSVGGWSQREIDLILSRVHFSLLKDEENDRETAGTVQESI